MEFVCSQAYLQTRYISDKQTCPNLHKNVVIRSWEWGLQYQEKRSEVSRQDADYDYDRTVLESVRDRELSHLPRNNAHHPRLEEGGGKESCYCSTEKCWIHCKSTCSAG